jgi:hypothetical protein
MVPPNLSLAGAQIIRKEYIVTFQMNFRLRADGEAQAEAMVTRAMSVGAGMAPQLMGMGVVAQPLTPEVLAQLGFPPDVGKRE